MRKKDMYNQSGCLDLTPFYALRNHPAVSLTPHMAWGAVEARQRCMDEIGKNILAFTQGESRSRVV